MNIFLLSARLPKPVGKADSFTVYHLAKYLMTQGHSVHVLSFIERGEEEDERRLKEIVTTLRTVRLRKWRALLGMALAAIRKQPLQVGYYWDRRMKRRVNATLAEENVDVVYAHLIRMADYLRRENGYPRILGMQISQTLNYTRMVEHTHSLTTRLLYRIELGFVREYELAVIKDFEQTFLISPIDCRSITGQDHYPGITFVPHGVDVQYFASLPDTTHSDGISSDGEYGDGSWDLVFNGDMGVATNIDSMVWFAEQILPLIWEMRPDTTLCIAGRHPASRIRALASDDRVTVTGAVADLRPFLHRSKVAVDPLRIGAGMQNKVLVSMAAGLPVVCTSIANEGIAAPVAEAIVIQDKPPAFAQSVVNLLQNPEKAATIGENGQRFVSERWTWDYHHKNWEATVKRLVASSSTVDTHEPAVRNRK